MKDLFFFEKETWPNESDDIFTLLGKFVSCLCFTVLIPFIMLTVVSAAFVQNMSKIPIAILLLPFIIIANILQLISGIFANLFDLIKSLINISMNHQRNWMILAAVATGLSISLLTSTYIPGTYSYAIMEAYIFTLATLALTCFLSTGYNGNNKTIYHVNSRERVLFLLYTIASPLTLLAFPLNKINIYLTFACSLIYIIPMFLTKTMLSQVACSKAQDVGKQNIVTTMKEILNANYPNICTSLKLNR